MLERQVLLTLVGVPVHGRCMPMATEDGARPTPKSFSDHYLYENKAQAHPPAAGGQPLPLFEQHQAFFATDQPAIQFAKPASQS